MVCMRHPKVAGVKIEEGTAEQKLVGWWFSKNLGDSWVVWKGVSH